MIATKELLLYVDTLLDCASFHDYAPNGLQVEGKSSISTLCTAVTASYEVIEKAVALGADALMVHHGYFWKGENPVVCGMKRQRLASLLQHDINLLAYHLPLDSHASLGNNAMLASLLEMEAVQMHTAQGTKQLLWSGNLSKAYKGKELAHYIEKKLQRAPLHIAGNDKPIQHLAWCSGGAEDFIEQAHLLGADAYISGEISERTYYQAQELGIHYYAAGHHATERYGIQALGNLLAKECHLTHHFIDSANPV